MAARRKVTFEKLSEDENGATYRVEAIHVGTTRNQRKYSREELTLGARSLSYRPINLNHQEDRWLPYNFANPIAEDSNTTLNMEFVPEKNGVIGEVWVTDKTTRENIDMGRIRTVSIEQLPTKGESCSCLLKECTCEQNGIVFTGIALLETHKGVQPGDPDASIKKKESIDYTIKVEASPELKEALNKVSGELKETKKAVEGCGCHLKGEEAFKCETCGMEFDSKEALDAHYKQAHSPEAQERRVHRQFLEALIKHSTHLEAQ